MAVITAILEQLRLKAIGGLHMGRRFFLSPSSDESLFLAFMRKPARFFVGCFALLGVVMIAHAHDPGLSSVQLTLHSNQIQAAMVFARADIESLLPLDKDLTTPSQKLSSKRARLERLALAALEIAMDGKRVPATAPRTSVDENNNVQFDLVFPVASGSRLFVRSAILSDLAFGHRQFVSVHGATNELLEEHLLSAKFDSFETELGGEAGETRPASRRSSFGAFLALGVKHILLGYDHLLFLFALLIVCDRFMAVVKIVTCFTVAHSLTLALATLDVVQIPGRVVEPVIAASIVYVSLENIFRRDALRWRWLLTFGFGLIHGFGFATVLREMGVASSGREVVVPLVAFNLGVELGQIGLASIFLPCFWKIKALPIFRKRWITVASMGVAMLGAYWLVERIVAAR